MIAKLETEGECRILRVSGRIDFESALDFEQQINAMIQQEADCFIIELSEVELLSSAGLRVLLSTAKRVSHRDSVLGLAAPSQVVSQVFEISHFNLLFKIFPSVGEAIAALKGTSYPATPVAAPAGSPENKQVTPRSADEPSKVAQPRVAAGEKDSQQEPTATGPIKTAPRGGLPPPPADRTSPVAKAAPAQTAVVPPPLPDVRAGSPANQPVRAAETAPPLQTVRPVAQPPGPSRPPEPVPEAPPTQPPKLPPLDVAKPQPQRNTRAAPQMPGPPPSAAETAVPVPRPPQVAAGQRVGGTPPRVEAPFPAHLEVRAEGKSYPCKDGDVIGGIGELGKAYFGQIPGLGPRHLLIGKAEGRWFVFTPKNVQHPFSMDGDVLVAGERRFLDYAEHQLEFSGHVFGLRLIPEQKKRGFFARLFGKSHEPKRS
jgi:anti-anti-sigma factor